MILRSGRRSTLPTPISDRCEPSVRTLAVRPEFDLLLLEQADSLALAAVTLALIGGAYIGFGAADGRRSVFWSELAVALVFGAAAVAGLLWHWAALPLGLALHALWDLAHHNAVRLARVPHWYIPFCVVFDLMAAAFLVLLYTR